MVLHTNRNTLKTQHLTNTQNEYNVLYTRIVIGRQQQHYERKAALAQTYAYAQTYAPMQPLIRL